MSQAPVLPPLPADVPLADAAVAASAPATQTRNPLHGVTLEAIVTALVTHFGWDELGQRIPVRCFTQDPSLKSSLTFLRKTPWAREKVEGLYLYMLRQTRVKTPLSAQVKP